jgi:hypothetical protein
MFECFARWNKEAKLKWTSEWKSALAHGYLAYVFYNEVVPSQKNITPHQMEILAANITFTFEPYLYGIGRMFCSSRMNRCFGQESDFRKGFIIDFVREVRDSKTPAESLMTALGPNMADTMLGKYRKEMVG